MTIPVVKTLGAGLLAQFLSSIVFGVSLLQLWQYFTCYSAKDGRFLKTYVAVISLFNVFHACLCYHYIYVYLVMDPAIFPVVDVTLIWSDSLSICAGAPQVLLIQIYFAYRVYVYSYKKLWPVFVIVILSFCQFAACIAVTIYELGGSFVNQHSYYIALGADIVANALIAILSTFYLRKMQKKSASRWTLRIIQILVVYSVRTCLLLTLLASAAILTIAFKKIPYSNIFYITGLRLYVCSFLSILNGREELWTNRDIGPSSINLQPLPAQSGVTKTRHVPIAAFETCHSNFT